VLGGLGHVKNKLELHYFCLYWKIQRQ